MCARERPFLSATLLCVHACMPELRGCGKGTGCAHVAPETNCASRTGDELRCYQIMFSGVRLQVQLHAPFPVQSLTDSVLVQRIVGNGGRLLMLSGALTMSECVAAVGSAVEPERCQQQKSLSC